MSKIKRFLQAIFIGSLFGLSCLLKPQVASALVLGSESQDSLSLSFSSLDGYPPGNSPFSNGPLTTLFDGQYWHVAAQSLAAPTGPAVGNSALYVEQVIPGQTALPKAVFRLSVRVLSPYTKQVSYLSDAAPTAFSTVTCSSFTSNCVSYEFQNLITFNPDPNFPFISSQRYDLQGFLQDPESKSVPEPSTVAGSLAALALISIVRFRRCFI
jgi:hypothetical protein